MTLSDPENLKDDLIWGVDGPDGIAAFLGLPERKCYYLISRGKIPVTKVGRRTIVASRTRLRAALAPEPA